MPSYRRRYRRYRRRPYGKRYSRRIGRRPATRKFARRPKYYRPLRRKLNARAITFYDRTPNWDGDSVITQYKEIVSAGLSRTTTTAGQYFVGNVIPGSHFSGGIIPDIEEYASQFRYMKVVKSTIVVEFVNFSDTVMKDVGITLLPNGVDWTEPTNLPNWTNSIVPSEQPRTKFLTLGPKSSSRSVRKLTMTATPLTAAGDLTFVTAGDTKVNVDTGGVTTEPTSPWYFYVWQGNSAVVNSGSTETTANNIQYRATIYRTCKFFERTLQTGE